MTSRATSAEATDKPGLRYTLGMIRPAPISAVHRVGIHGRSLEVRIPADLVRELRIIRREFAVISRGPGRSVLVRFTEPGDDAGGDLLRLAARPDPRPEAPAVPAAVAR
ncbi:MAG: hypothetical protein Q8Q14_03460 [Gemmatimonadales bacterium]|nr:hypothetical protein [Gemmatimonadales bacterium]